MTLVLGLLLGIGLSSCFVAIRKQRPPSLMDRISAPKIEVPTLSFEVQTLRRFFTARKSAGRVDSRVLRELPEILEMLSIALSAGDSLFAAFVRVIPSAKGVLALELQKALIGLELGSDFADELKDLAIRLPHRQVIELCTKLTFALRRGSPLAQLLREQAETVRAELRNAMLRDAGRNETKMLVPLVFLILPTTVLFAIYPSVLMLGSTYN